MNSCFLGRRILKSLPCVKGGVTAFAVTEGLSYFGDFTIWRIEMGKYQACQYKQCDKMFYINGCWVIIDGYHCVLKDLFRQIAEFDLRTTSITVDKGIIYRTLILRSRQYQYEVMFNPFEWRKLNREIRFE